MLHQYKLNGYSIVLDTCSGSIHAVDPVIYDMIERFEGDRREDIISHILEKYRGQEDVTKEEVEECYDDIQGLKDRKKLFTEDNYEKLALAYKNNSKVIKALCLHVAHTCNLNCSYCFAAQGNYQGGKALMSFEVGKQAFDFLIKNSGTRVNLEVDFFGGEPLMDWQVVKDLVNYARTLEPIHNKKFRFTLTTNGVLIDDDVIEFANREMHNIVLSLDGRKEVHDHLRKDYQGRGSYDVILPKFKEFVEKRDGKGYYMRGTFTHNNVDFTEDIFHMADLGFKELSMEPVVCDPNDAYALTAEDMPKLFEQYEILAIDMIARKKAGAPISFYHYNLDLTNGPCIYKRITGCGSGTEYMAVTPWGELFPCHQFVGDEQYSLGNIWDGVQDKAAQDEFRSCNIYSKQECRECWANLYCSGGCPANAFHATGDINGIYEYGCQLFKRRIECAIMMQVAETA